MNKKDEIIELETKIGKIKLYRDLNALFSVEMLALGVNEIIRTTTYNSITMVSKILVCAEFVLSCKFAYDYYKSCDELEKANEKHKELVK